MSTSPQCFFRNSNATASHSPILIFRGNEAGFSENVSSEKSKKGVGKGKETLETKNETKKSLDSLKNEVDKAKEIEKKNDEKIRRNAATPKDSITFINKLVQACYDNYPMGKGEAENFETSSRGIQKDAIERLKSALDPAEREEVIRNFITNLVMVLPNIIFGVTDFEKVQEDFLKSID